MPQLNEYLYQLGRQQAWQIQIATLSVNGKLEDKDNHPLSPSQKHGNRGQGQVSLDTFVNRINKLGKGR